MRKVNFYRDKSGYCPVEEFLDSLNAKQTQKIVWVLRLIEEQDFIPSTYLKKLVNTEDIWEVRVQSGNNIFRILGFFEHNNLIILNHAFQKKSQKTPERETEIAERNYLMRG